MNSCLYEGWVRHRRSQPVRHSFRYRLFLVCLDLDELDVAFAGRWFWSARRPALAWFRRQDHFGEPHESLSESVRNFVSAHGRPRPTGPIRLLTHLRYWGFVFNPVSFFYCYAADGATVTDIVAEVNNTPWGERHCYLLSDPLRGASRRACTTVKTFHVSPFLPMSLVYRWQLTAPDEDLLVRLASYERGRPAADIDGPRRSDRNEAIPMLDVCLRMQRRPLTGGNLARVLIQYPFLTIRVVAAIYWQAWRLWRKRCRFYPHPKRLLQPGKGVP